MLILFGGRSAEHEISIISGGFITDSLDPERFEPLLVSIDPDGGWHLLDEAQRSRSKDPRQVSVDRSGPRAWLMPMPTATARAAQLFVEGREPIDFDVAFPVLHGPLGEDGAMQGLLELAGVPYVGSGVTGSAVGMDKVIQKRVFQHCDLPLLPWEAVTLHDWRRKQDDVVAACEALGYPLFVKPANMGSSLGISRATDREGLLRSIAQAFELDTKLVVEHGLSQPREIECSVLGNHDARVSVPGEIVVRHRDGFYSYDAKYIDDGADLRIPAELYYAEQNAIQLIALRAFHALDCAGLARVDMFMSPDREIYLNEVNTIPGFTAISMYPSLWKASGLEPQALVSTLIDLALERHHERRALRTTR